MFSVLVLTDLGLHRLQQWLMELVGSNRRDPVFRLHWVPDLSMTETTVYMNIQSEADRLDVKYMMIVCMYYITITVYIVVSKGLNVRL